MFVWQSVDPLQEPRVSDRGHSAPSSGHSLQTFAAQRPRLGRAELSESCLSRLCQRVQVATYEIHRPNSTHIQSTLRPTCFIWDYMDPLGLAKNGLYRNLKGPTKKTVCRAVLGMQTFPGKANKLAARLRESVCVALRYLAPRLHEAL